MLRLNFYQAYKSPALIEHTTFYTALFNRLHSSWLIAAPYLSLALRSHVYQDMSDGSQTANHQSNQNQTQRPLYLVIFQKTIFNTHLF